MLQIAIPGRDPLTLEHLVCDVNGTLAVDGLLLPRVAERLAELSGVLAVHLLTADMHGSITQIVETIERACTEAGVAGPRWERVGTGADKAEYATRLGGARVAALGNGANDVMMSRVAALSIGVVGSEGLYGGMLFAAHVIAASPLDALDLLRHPARLTATLRL
jgi:soluble P-type ATPase